MSSDPLKLVKFVCVERAHARGRSDSALTIHEGAWAVCPMGAEAKGHDWKPSEGLPLTGAMRFTPRQQAGEPAPNGQVLPARRGSTAGARGKTRPR